MKTALEQLIYRLDKTEKQLDKENNLVMSSALFTAKQMALEFLEKEKEQLIKAHIDGFDHIVVDFKKQEYAEQYYNETYKQ